MNKQLITTVSRFRDKNNLTLNQGILRETSYREKTMFLARKAILPILLLTVVYLSSAGVARADVITFNSLQQAGTNLISVPDPYIEAGFRLTDQQNFFAAQQSHVLYAGSAGLHERVSNGLITLNRVDAAAFNLISIDLSILHPNGTSPAVVFTGIVVGGGTVTQSFTPTVFGFQTFVFNGSFANLTSVSWRQGSDEPSAHQFDNIVANASVPEPATMLLLGTGLAGIAAKLRKRHARLRRT